jgi:hypothetical protein
VIPNVVAIMGRKYTKITGGTNSKNFSNFFTPESQKITATRVARKAKTDMGSVNKAWGSGVIVWLQCRGSWGGWPPRYGFRRA